MAVVGCGIWDPGGLGVDDALTVHRCSVHSQQIGPNNTIIKVKGKLLWAIHRIIFYLDASSSICF